MVIFIQIDALRHDYISAGGSPFLWELEHEGISGNLIPGFGFEPDGAYLAGLWPDECDGGAHFWRNPEKTSYGLTKCLPDSLGQLQGTAGRIFRKILTRIIRSRSRWRYEFMPCALYSVLRQIAPVPKLFPPGARGGKIKDIFFLCKEQGISFFFHGSPLNRVNIVEGVRCLASGLFPPTKFAFWHIGDLDSVGHRFGPESLERKKTMSYVDAKINEVIDLLKKRFEALHIIVIGDHGMAEVRSYLDIPGRLKACGINGPEVPFYFLDSTMARFWFSEMSQREAVEKALGDLPGGRILTRADLDRYHLNYGHNRFGELIYLADAGVLLSPNYFQGRTWIKGMHGYAPECPEQQSAFIINSSEVAVPAQIDEPVDMRRIFPTILKCLGIAIPDTCNAQSII